MKKSLLFCLLSFFALWSSAENNRSLEAPTEEIPADATDITLCVDMSCLESITAPTVFGAFNGWNAGANPVVNQGDGIYCATVSMGDGNQEFKFFRQEGEETFDPVEDAACTLTTGPFTNRIITVGPGQPTSYTWGWESCDMTCQAPPMPTTTDITLCADLSCFSNTDAAAVVVNGSNPGTPLIDQGNGIFCATVGLESGPQGFVFFTAVEQFEDFDLPEDGACTINGQRVINVVEGQEATYTYGWESCDPEATCSTTTDITLCVDLSCFPQVDAAAVGGDFNGFAANAFLTNTGNGVYCRTVALESGPQEFKFFFAQEQFENFGPEDAACTANGNRIIDVVEGQTASYTFGWERCDDQCILPGANVTFCVNTACAGLNPGNVAVFGQFNGFNSFANPMVNQGNGEWCTTVFLPSGPQEYLFLADGVAESFPAFQDICTVTCCGGAFTNRIINIVDGQDQTVQFDFESCDYTPAGSVPVWSYDNVSSVGSVGNTDASPCDVQGNAVDLDFTAFNLNSAPNDNHGFLHSTLCGDGEISMRVANVEFGAYVGVSLRDNLSPGAKQVSLFSNLTNILRFEARSTIGAPAQVFAFYKPSPFWIRLVRQGNWVFGYYSPTGNNWTYVHAVFVPMGNCVEAGISIFSYLPANNVEASVDNVNLTEYYSGFSGNPPTPPVVTTTESARWNLYPNPAADNLSVEWGQEAQPTQLKLFNQYGQMLKLQQIDGSGRIQLPVHDLNAGSYWIEMLNGDQRIKVLPFIKQ